MFETEIDQHRLIERSNRVVRWYQVPVQVGADSKIENPDPTHNNINNHNPKTNTERKLK